MICPCRWKISKESQPETVGYQPYWVEREDRDDDIFHVGALGGGDVELEASYVVQCIPRQQSREG